MWTCQVFFLLASSEPCEGQPGLRDVTQIQAKAADRTSLSLPQLVLVVGHPSVACTVVQQEGAEEEETHEHEEEELDKRAMK